MSRPELSLVIPIYNEEEVLPQLDVRLKELLGKLDGLTTEVVFVNDGSKDASMDILRRMAGHEPRYKVLGFSRNFGHQRAITAGMDKARGRAIVVMDADLQDPPEVILEMVAKWKQGFDVVYGRRRSRVGESWFKLFTAKWFYRVFAALIPIEVPLDAGDFRLMSRRVVRTLSGLRENHRFVRGLVAWVGFKQTAVEYDRAARAAGETKYPLKKMLAFALDGIASFSIQPLRFATYIGVFVGAASVLYAIASIITYAAGMNVPGWTTQVVLVAFLFSVQFFMLGVLGEYVGRIYEQSKRRPLYVLSERINFGSKKRSRKLATNDIVEAVRAPSFPPPSGRTPSVPPALPRTSKPPSVTTAAATPASVPPQAAARPASVPPSVGAQAAAKPASMGVQAAAKSASVGVQAAGEVPPPPAAVVAAGAVAEASISSHMPARKSVTPAPPATASNKPPPLKLSSSLSSIPAAPHAPATGPAGPPRSASSASVPPPLPRTPSAPPVAAEPRTTPSAPPVRPAGHTPSAPPVRPAGHTPSAPPVRPAGHTPSAPPVRPAGHTPSAPAVRPSGHTPSAPAVRPSGHTPSAPAVRPSGYTPNAPAVRPSGRTPSAPPGAATPSVPPRAATPSAPPGAATPSVPPAPPGAATPSAPPGAVKSVPPSMRTPSAPPVQRASVSAMRAAAGAPPPSKNPSGAPRAPSVPAMRAAKADAMPETARSPSAVPTATTDEPSDT
ncbi:MAG: glycosyltransferase [Labilithrix sp.]|nr:glycosyltransferase [Labilithrix sp.]MCW5810817.1 glycosyltransferase [Labilithrix sp.]